METDFTPDEIGEAVDRADRDTRIRAITAMDANPDEAARALELSDATGVPAPVIHGDLEGFENRHKASLIGAILADSPELRDYVNGNPLAAKVSADDWGELGNFVRAAPTLHKIIQKSWGVAGKAVEAGVVGAGRGAYEGITSPVPVGEKFQGLDLPRRVIEAFGGAISGGATEGAKQFARGMDLSDTEVEQIGRDVGTLLEESMGRVGEHTPHAAAKPWTDAGLEPPRGLHPEIDKFKANLNASVLESIDEHMAAAQASATRERHPPSFETIAKDYYQSSTVGISGDRVLELYGDRVPSPDDGLLGWIPDLEQKLEIARATGDDVHVPLSGWVTYMDPAVARELHDDIRAWPGGITAREATEVWESAPIVDSPMAMARAANGTEPMFSIGDRKLTLQQTPSLPGHPDFHEFQFLDHEGKPVGELTLSFNPAKKEIYVDNINGLAGLHANSFGPSLVRDLKRQIKELYPDYEWITGHRVSGARELAGTWESEVAFPRVRLMAEDVGEGFHEFKGLLNDKAIESLGHGIHAELLRPEDLSPEQHSFIQIAADELAKLTGGRSKLHIRGGISAEFLPGAPIRGLSFGGKVFLDLFGPDRLGVLRHEAGHELRRMGLIKDTEWGMLKDTADAEGWLDKYGINERYPHLDATKKFEEAIVEALREYSSGKYIPERSAVRKIFDRIIDLWNKIVERWTGETGYTAEQLFDRILSGEIGKREAQVAADRAEPMFSIEDARAKMESLRAEVLGLDQRTYKKLDAITQERFKKDLAAAQKRAIAHQKKIQTEEWKAETAQLKKDVEANIKQRPDVRTDIFISTGVLDGTQLEKKMYPLRSGDLTDEQKRALPRRYWSSDGLPVDALANLMGYGSGEEMVGKLIEYNRDKGSMTSTEHLRKVIDTETARQMEQKFGDLNANIMRDAEDEAISESEVNLALEEWQGLAMQHGVAAIDKDIAKQSALELFAKYKVGDVSYDRLKTQALKHSQDATKDLIKGDPISAVQRLERRFQILALAAEAKKLEKERASLDKVAKQFRKREVPSVEPEYTNHIHDILSRIGYKIGRSSHDIAKEIEAADQKSLADFVAAKTGQLREVPVWPQLFDDAWRKPLEELTTEEFRAINDSIKALVHNGRDERKILRQGEAHELAEVKRGLISAVADSVNRKVVASTKRTFLKNYYVASLQMENILNRWDGFVSKGLWNQYVMRDLIDGANQVDAWKKEYAQRIKDLPAPKDIDRTVENPLFKDMDTGAEIPFTRKNLLAVMLNTGTGTGAKSNLHKLAAGYGLTPDQVMAWIHAHATKEDWAYVRGMWDIFADIKVKADKMYRSLSGGVAPEDLPTFPIQTPHGEVKGGYYPIFFHEEMEGRSQKLMGGDALEQDGYFRAAPPAGYTKGRTGYVAPLSLDLDQIPGRITQMLHDIGLRPAIINAGKVFYDKDVRSAVRKHYGTEYRDQFVDYLKAVANSQNQMTKSQAIMNKWGELLRQNVITTLVGLNPGTVMKHGPSALVTSIREVGPDRFRRAALGMWRVNEQTGESNWQFAMKNSLELQRRDRNWEETLYGAGAGTLTPGDKFTPLRMKVIEWSSKPVAMSDMLSAVPTWLAAYEKEMEASGIHGDAVYEADRAVRRAHGSTAITNRPKIVREISPWLTSVYNFFSDIMNRQMEAIWRAGEMKQLAQPGQRAAGMKAVGAFTASLFAYAVWPAIVEHLVSGETGEEKEPWGKTAAKAMVRTAASSWIGVRDFTNWLLYGHDPQFGLAGTAVKELGAAIADLKKDHPFHREHRGRLIQDSAGLIGAMTGMLPAQVGRSARYGHDVWTKVEHPKGPWEWLTGLRYGTTKGHSRTFQDYLKGRTQ